MRRLLAEVVEADRLPESGNQSGPGWQKVRCRVKVLSGIPEYHHLPGDVKDTTCTVTREALFDWEYKPGTKLVLNPEECGRLVARPVNVPEAGPLRGRVITYRTDINSDGFTERVMENSFVKVVIGPRFGARIWEIWHKRRGVNPLYQTYDFGDDFIELGGQQDGFTEQKGLGEFWKSEFAEKEVTTDEKGCRAVYEFKSEDSKGITLTKEILLPVDTPAVFFRCTFRYSGAEKPPEDGKPDEFDLTYWPRVGIAAPEPEAQYLLFLMPTKARMQRARPVHQWWVPRAFGMSAPYSLALSEETGQAVALLMDHEKVNYGMVHNGRDFTTMEPRMKTVKVPKDGEASFSHALVVADASCAREDGLAMVTVGPEEDGRTPVFAMSTLYCPGSAALGSGGDDVRVEMSGFDYPGLPKVCIGTSWDAAGPVREPFGGFALDGCRWQLESGGNL